MSNSHAASARFYDPGASPLSSLSPEKCRGSGAPLDASVRTWSAPQADRQRTHRRRRHATWCRQRQHPRTRPAALHGADRLAPSALLLRRFLSPDRFR